MSRQTTLGFATKYALAVFFALATFSAVSAVFTPGAWRQSPQPRHVEQPNPASARAGIGG
jgi:hypothetical protein